MEDNGKMRKLRIENTDKEGNEKNDGRRLRTSVKRRRLTREGIEEI